MKCSVAKQCEYCKKDFREQIDLHQKLVCTHCSHSWVLQTGPVLHPPCSFCQAKDYYVQKDFNPIIGLSLVLIGILFVPMTYGLSLPALCLFDWLLYKRVPDLALCYKCGAEYRGFQLTENIQPYSHHTAYYYEKFEDSRVDAGKAQTES